jgi:cell wall-associated NlpC family hydrolase
LAQLLHRWVGINTLPRDADLQYEAGKKIEPPFQPGDLLFFGEKGEKRSITHVAISMGNWRIIHSSRSHNGVYIDDVQEVEHLRDSFIGAATFL